MQVMFKAIGFFTVCFLFIVVPNTAQTTFKIKAGVNSNRFAERGENPGNFLFRSKTGFMEVFSLQYQCIPGSWQRAV
jgi:hypothetical protein